MLMERDDGELPPVWFVVIWCVMWGIAIIGAVFEYVSR